MSTISKLKARRQIEHPAKSNRSDFSIFQSRDDMTDSIPGLYIQYPVSAVGAGKRRILTVKPFRLVYEIGPTLLPQQPSDTD